MAEKNEASKYSIEGIWAGAKEKWEKVKDFWPDDDDFEILDPNIAFYKNEIPFHPYGKKIEYILQYWNGNYVELELNHNYIQWLFPNRIPGLNQYASVLTDDDVKCIRSNQKLTERVKKAFEMMLDFYGMRLTKENEFELTENSKERLQQLNRRFNHNFQRITRILLAIKELGHNHLMLPWMKFLADLIYKDDVLDCAAKSFDNHWIDTLDAEETIELKFYLEKIKSIGPLDSMSTIPSTISTTSTNIINGNDMHNIMSTTNDSAQLKDTPV